MPDAATLAGALLVVSGAFLLGLTRVRSDSA
jgi:ABC-type Fe3+-siderophore transport system permease subunit